MSKGPTIKVKLSCFECSYCRSSRYTCQGDSGSDVFCSHPSIDADKRDIGDTCWDTPEWCPLLSAETKAAIATLTETASTSGAQRSEKL